MGFFAYAKEPTLPILGWSNMRLCLILICLFVSTMALAKSTVANNLQNITNQYLIQHRINEGATAIELTVRLPKGKTRTFYSGLTAYQKGSPLSRSNLFKIGSITKSFVTVLILQLEAEGKLNINDPITRYLPQYPKWKDVTIKQLLNMTSGIYPFVDSKGFRTTFKNNTAKQFTSKDLIAYAYNNPKCGLSNKVACPTVFKPGASYEYSNTNYVLAGMIIEKITGQPLSEVLQKRLLNKFKLRNTFYLPYMVTRLPKRYAKFNIPKRMAKEYHSDPLSKTRPENDTTDYNLSWAGPAGAMVSNTRDITKWIYALFSGKVLPAKQFKKMTSLVCMNPRSCQLGAPITIKAIEGPGYALGLLGSNASLGPIWSYEGRTFGSRVIYYWMPEVDILVTAAVNSSSNYDIDNLALLLSRAVKYLINVKPVSSFEH